MTHKRKHSIGQYLLRAVMAVPMLFGVMGNIFSLIEIEARLTVRSLFFILTLSILMVAILTTTWVCLLAMLFLYLISWQLSWQLSLFILVLLNIVLLILLVWMLNTIKRHMFFPETRALVKSFLQK